MNTKSLLAGLRSRYFDWRFGMIDSEGPIGKRGEQAAARHLRQHGFLVLAESESDRAGEIDIIAVEPKKRMIVFVEVKTLATTKPGHPADRVDELKQGRITRAALRYLKRKNLIGTACRFDVIAIWWPNEWEGPRKIQHYEAAFEAVGDFQMY